MAAPDSMTDAIDGKAVASYVRRGQATVAGVACIEWQTQDREPRPALVCTTEDSGRLRVSTQNRTRVSAVSGHCGLQDPAAFRVPADYVRRSPETAR